MSIKAFELVPVIEKINVLSDKTTTQIICLECCGKNLYFGTEDCFVIHYLMEETQDPVGRTQHHSTRLGHKFLGLKKPVMQLKAASAINRILVLCDNALSMLNMINLEPVVSGSKIRGIQYFTVNENPARSNPFSVEICVATKRKCIQIYVLSEDRVTMTKEITTTDIPTTLSMDGVHVCVAMTSQYNIINVESGCVQDLFDFDSAQVKPIVTRISREELLLSASSGLGVFTLLRGMSRRPPLQWNSNVTHVVYSHPYVVAVNDEFITVHSVLDQQQKQTILFNGARYMGEFDGRMYIVTSRDVYQLTAIPVEKQIQSLLADKRVTEALELAHSARKLTTSKDEFNRMLQRIQKQAGFIEFVEGNFDGAYEQFKSSQLDVRELISLYPGFLSGSSTFVRSVPPLHEIADITQLTKGSVTQTEAYERFLLQYIEDLRGLITTTTSDNVQAFSMEADTALVKLYAKLNPSQLITFLQSSLGSSPCLSPSRQSSLSPTPSGPRPRPVKSRPLECDMKECIDWLSRYGCYYAEGLLHAHVGDHHKALDIWTRIYSGHLQDAEFPGLEFLVDFLTRLQDTDLVWKHADWIMSQDQSLGVKIFTDRLTPPTSPSQGGGESVNPPSTSLTDNDVVVDYLVGRYEQAIIIYLEYIIEQRNIQYKQLKTEKNSVPWPLNSGYLETKLRERDLFVTLREKFHTHLAVLYLDRVLRLMNQKEENKNKEQDGGITLQEARKKLSEFLHKSSMYRVQLLLGKIQHTELYNECAILYGKLEEHDKALRLLVHKLRDFDAAERYCVMNSSGVSEAYKTRLFTALLAVYLDPTNERRDSFIGPAISLLNNTHAEFDSVKVLQMLPENWSVGLLHKFLMRTIRQSLAGSRTHRVERMLARCENLRVREISADVMSPSLYITEDLECEVCGQCFTEPEFTRYPNGTIAHIHCAPDLNKCPVTGQMFSMPRPSQKPLPSDVKPRPSDITSRNTR